MYIILATFFLFGFHTSAKSQFTLVYKDYNIEFNPKKCHDTITVKAKERVFKFYIFDCDGSSKVEVFNKNSVLIESGAI